MRRRGLTYFFPQDEPEQRLRLKRFLFATAAYAMNSAFVLACWYMGYFSVGIVSSYAVIVLTVNVLIYLMIRSGFNKRFADPSLTGLQMTIAALTGVFVMYYASEFRSAFLLLGVSMLTFGMFRFKTWGIAGIGAVLLAGYAGVLVLLALYRPQELRWKVEVLQWLALLVTLIQFTFVAGYIGNLRYKLRLGNQEMAKKNAELEQALQRISDMAIRDELTGAYNRRYVTDRIDLEAQRCMRNGSVFCLCMLDVDFFKNVNDSYGHPAGDEVLRQVAAVASSMLRVTDVFGRFGGEEFILLATDTTASGAMAVAERIRQGIEQLSLPEIDPALRVTVSIGVAEHLRGATPAQTIKSADAALYRAKESGRNRCLLAPSSPSRL